jgi:hypothetical protein
MEKC